MGPTSVSMLRQLQGGEDPTSWRLLLETYRPFLLALLRARGAPAQDLDDLVQDILLVVVRELPAFEYNGRTGAFRSWLRAIAANRLRSYWRSQGKDVPTDMAVLAEQFDDPQSEPSRLWDARHDQHVLARLLDMIEGRCDATTYQAFRRLTLDGADPIVVAAELDMSVAAVYIAKSRLLKRLRDLAAGLVD